MNVQLLAHRQSESLVSPESSLPVYSPQDAAEKFGANQCRPLHRDLVCYAVPPRRLAGESGEEA